ncbi:MAG: extracellular solute-binding protein, partial [Desulfamplus sp.]|nr:extracellular solute-binding protein [Desulfamplus sp.]
MVKKLLIATLSILLIYLIIPCYALLHARELGLTEQTVLTMGSWRTDDILQMRKILDLFEKSNPGIRVIFDPTPAAEYDAVLEAQLKSGSAPDIFYLRSFNISSQLFEKGYLEPLDDLPDLKENFTPHMLAPWRSTKSNTIYGVPFIATAHGIYYNKAIFDKLNLDIPTTWEELLNHARIIQDSGLIPFANASGEAWTINEIVFFNLAPNFIGGYQGRLAYLNGERCFNDTHMVAAFQALADVAPFFPPNHTLLKYSDTLQMFIQGQAAMWMGGSWDIPFIESESPAFGWDIFAPPSPKGSPQFITFHLDAGIGLNRSSKQKEAALTFLSWIARPESGKIMANELPGF